MSKKAKEEVPLYIIFKIPKRNGKFRVIEAPCEKLKLTQAKSLEALQKYFKVSPFAHAFRPYKNIATMAMAHVGKNWVGCIDIKDFFPSITLEMIYRVYGMAETDMHWHLKPNFHDFDDGKGLRLPQGAPNSPFISNVYLFEFDYRMAWNCLQSDCDYTRYADDIVISGNNRKDIYILFKIAEGLLNRYGLHVNHSKTKVMHKTQRQLVCGVVVNEKLNLKRKWRKNLRAEIFQQKGGDLRENTKGRLAFQNMILNNTKESYSSRQICQSLILKKKMDSLAGGAR